MRNVAWWKTKMSFLTGTPKQSLHSGPVSLDSCDCWHTMGALSRANYVLWSWINGMLRMPPLAARRWWQEHPTKSGWEKGPDCLRLSSESLPPASCLSGFLCSSFYLRTLHHHLGVQAFCPFILSSPSSLLWILILSWVTVWNNLS